MDPNLLSREQGYPFLKMATESVEGREHLSPGLSKRLTLPLGLGDGCLSWATACWSGCLPFSPLQLAHKLLVPLITAGELWIVILSTGGHAFFTAQKWGAQYQGALVGCLTWEAWTGCLGTSHSVSNAGCWSEAHTLPGLSHIWGASSPDLERTPKVPGPGWEVGGMFAPKCLWCEGRNSAIPPPHT